MQAYIVGKKADQTVVYKSGTYGDKAPPEELCVLDGVKADGGLPGDYEVLYIDDQAALKRISTGEIPAISYISGDKNPTLDFTAENSKAELTVTASKTSIDANGSDSATVNFTLSDSASGERLIPCFRPGGPVLLRLAFDKGTASITFTTTEAGAWLFGFNGRNAEMIGKGSALVHATLKF